MEKLHTLNKELFSMNNVKKAIKKGMHIGVLTAALFSGATLTGCQQETPQPPYQPPYQEKDNCDICDGVQDASHEHDYCLECEGVQGSDHEHQVVTPEPTEPTWFKEATIGGENSLYKVNYIDNDLYNSLHEVTSTFKTDKVNNYLDLYKSYVENLKLDETLTDGVQIDLNSLTSFDALIGSTDNSSYYNLTGLNDVCAPAMEKIIQNVGSGDTEAVDKAYFAIYFKAIVNEAYRKGYNGEPTSKDSNGSYINNSGTEMENKYNEEKSNCEYLYGGDAQYLPFENKYFYDETGNLNPEVVQQFDNMVVAAANKLGITTEKARAVVECAIGISSAEGLHDLLSATLLVNDHTHNDICPNNEMYEYVIEPVAFPRLSMAPTKLNKSIFNINNKNIDRELC